MLITSTIRRAKEIFTRSSGRDSTERDPNEFKWGSSMCDLEFNIAFFPELSRSWYLAEISDFSSTCPVSASPLQA